MGYIDCFRPESRSHKPIVSTTEIFEPGWKWRWER